MENTQYLKTSNRLFVAYREDPQPRKGIFRSTEFEKNIRILRLLFSQFSLTHLS